MSTLGRSEESPRSPTTRRYSTQIFARAIRPFATKNTLAIRPFATKNALLFAPKNTLTTCRVLGTTNGCTLPVVSTVNKKWFID